MAIQLNRYLMRCQYFFSIQVFFAIFAIVGAALIPIAYIVGIIDKIKTMHLQPDS